jgi:anaerobic selenocysteine-containing dehydrogenase
VGGGAGDRGRLAAPIRETDPKKLAFFTGRDQSQSFTSFWAQAFGTPNYAAHGGFCSVNMAAAGIMTLGGAFWEFGSAGLGAVRVFHDLRRGRGP